jgi:hypothetical protein
MSGLDWAVVAVGGIALYAWMLWHIVTTAGRR